MAAQTSLTSVLSNGNWILQYRAQTGGRVFPVPGDDYKTVSGGWRQRIDPFSTPGTRGGFLGQSPLASGAPPRGASIILHEYDPDGGIDILDGEIRVERIGPPLSPVNGTTRYLIDVPTISMFRATSFSTSNARFEFSGDVDARQTPTSGLNQALRFRVGGDLILCHHKSISAVSFSFDSQGSQPRIAGLLDLRRSSVSTINSLPSQLASFETTPVHHVDASRSSIAQVGAFSGSFWCSGSMTLDGCKSLRTINAHIGGDCLVRDSRLDSFATIEVVGNLDLRGSSIKTLPETGSVGGNLDIRETRIHDIPGGFTVGGDVIR